MLIVICPICGNYKYTHIIRYGLDEKEHFGKNFEDEIAFYLFHKGVHDYVGYSISNYTKEQLAELDEKNIEYNSKMYSDKKSERRSSHFKRKENTVYLAKRATLTTIAHELFHKVDYDNEIIQNGLLDDCINSDYENLKKIAEKAGLSIEDMLYLKYPEAFKKKAE